MITNTALKTSTVLQTSGGGFNISMEILVLIGIAAIIVIALIWMLTQNTGAD